MIPNNSKSLKYWNLHLKLTNSVRRTSKGRPELYADEGGRADDVADDDDDRQFDGLDFRPRYAFDGAGSRCEGRAAFIVSCSRSKIMKKINTDAE